MNIKKAVATDNNYWQKSIAGEGYHYMFLFDLQILLIHSCVTS